MKIIYIGAGSTQFLLDTTRHILAYPHFAGATIALVDIQEERLSRAHRMVEKYAREANVRLNIESSTDRRELLSGADYVITTVKVGGYTNDEVERRIASERGYLHGIGDGVSDYYGGIGAYNQLKFFDDLATDMEELCPDAWLLNPSNPVFEVSTFMLRRHSSIKFIGLCHGHWGSLVVPGALGLDPAKFQYETYGFDHCLFLTRMSYEGKDIYPLFSDWVNQKFEAFWEEFRNTSDPRFDFIPDGLSLCAIDMYRKYGLFPVGDTMRSVYPWWYQTDLETQIKYYGKGGGMDSDAGWQSYLKYNQSIKKQQDDLLDSSDSIIGKYPIAPPAGDIMSPVRLINALAFGETVQDIISIPNRGLVDDIPNDVTVNILADINSFGVRGIRPTTKLPTRIMSNVIYPRLQRVNNLVEAYIEGSRDLLVMYLMQDHRTRSYEQAAAIIDELLALPLNFEATKHYR